MKVAHTRSYLNQYDLLRRKLFFWKILFFKSVVYILDNLKLFYFQNKLNLALPLKPAFDGKLARRNENLSGNYEILFFILSCLNLYVLYLVLVSSFESIFFYSFFFLWFHMTMPEMTNLNIPADGFEMLKLAIATTRVMTAGSKTTSIMIFNLNSNNIAKYQ